MKVFGIGLPKTGTVSLATALRTLGFETTHNPWPYQGDVFRLAEYRHPEPFDALVHCGEWWFPQLDRLYPDSRFVLTTRDLDPWLDCCAAWWPRFDPSVAELRNVAVFGTRVFHREQFADVHARHARVVLDYFAGRPEALLVLPVEAPDKFTLLATFLGLPVPQVPYPHENRREVWFGAA